MLQLFLSYAREDAAPVRRLAADLRCPGIAPWMDDELKLAGRWNDEINERIPACDLFVAVLSRATQEGEANRFFRKEWRLAVQAQRRLLPLRLEPCQLPATLPEKLTAELRRWQWQDLFPSYEDGLRRVLRFLHAEARSGVFEETFSCLGPDNAAWRLGGWQLDPADSTGGRSGSLYAVARLAPTLSPAFAAPALLQGQTARQIAAIGIELPGQPLRLRYRRRLRLAAPIGGEARFQVAVDGEVIDTAQAGATEDDWTTRSVPIPDRGVRRATLELAVLVSSRLNYLPVAEAWVDDLRIA
jgi:hypothetical protein